MAKIEILAGKEMGKRARSGLSVGTNKVFGANYCRGEETMQLTPDERAEWLERALPPGAKSRFKFLQSQELKGRFDSALIEVKYKVCFLGNKKCY